MSENPYKVMAQRSQQSVKPLSDTEQARLAQLETIIDKGLATFIEVAQSLMAIRQEKLYRNTHKTFEEYMTSRFDISRPRGYQLMAAAQVVENLSTIVDKNLPENEGQIRPLTSLQPTEQIVAWEVVQELAETNKVTGKLVKAVAASAAEKFREFMETKGSISLNGESVNLLKASIVEDMEETMNRQSAHIADRSNWPKLATIFEDSLSRAPEWVIDALASLPDADTGKRYRIVVYVEKNK